MKIYANDGTKLSWPVFIVFVIVCIIAWTVLGGIPAGVAAMFWGAEGAIAVWGTWMLGVAGITVVSLVRAFRNIKKNDARFGGLDD